MHKPTILAFAVTACLAAAPASAAELADALTPEAALKCLPAYTCDQPRRLLRFLEAEVQRAAGDADRARAVADRLAKVLADPQATLDARRFVCRWLPLVAGDAHVPVLARLLAKEETAEMARQALQAIPGEASGKVLRGALAKAKGEALVGLVNALGARRDAASVGLIARHLDAKDAAVAAAAADALGNIGTVEAAETLTDAAETAEGDLADTLRDARLRCARHLATAGDREAAGTIYTDLLAGDLPVRWRIAAMMGMVDGRCPGAAAVVERALGSGDARLRASAIQAAGRIAEDSMTERLVKRLPGLAPPDQVLLLGVLADRGDAAARPGVLKCLDADEGAVRAAAAAALGALGTAEDVPRLLDLAAAGEGTVRVAAREALSRLDAEGADKRLLEAAASAGNAERVAAVRALPGRRTPGAAEVLLGAAAEGDTDVRVAALESLAYVGMSLDAAHYAELLDVLVRAEDDRVVRAAEQAAIAAARRRPNVVARIFKPLKEGPPQAKVRLLGILPAVGGGQLFEFIQPHLDVDNQAVRDAAVRALVAWPDAAAADLVLKVAKESKDRTHRVLALRGYMRLMKEHPFASERQRMMHAVRPLLDTPEIKKLFLAGLASMTDPFALEAAKAFLDDPAVAAEAKAAVKKIRASQKRKPRPRRAPVPKADPKALAARKQELAKGATDGFHLACYMDCGPQTAAGGKDGPRLRVAAGAPYFWGGSDRKADVRYGTILFTEREVAFEATGLDPRRAYRLGFSWWDYDHDTRAESVWASPRGGGPAERLLAKTKLPSGARGEKPAEIMVELPRGLTAAGAVRIAFRREAGPNAVVSEVWLWESDTASAPADAAPEASAETSAATKVLRSSRSGGARVLLVTGIDHPGHKWRETAPVLRVAIEKDERLAVDIVEDPGWLETGDLAPYKVVVHHWMDWKVSAPGAKARARLERFVRGGGGLVMVHFACGAWQDWPEFVKIAGRVWNPDLRAHDPRGPFTVRIVDADHPITRGLPASFETTDELYTCLDGDTPVHVLAKATSKVDKKDYPMAFVLTCGKGRVFHCVLGHDVKALEPEPVKALYRRGTAWAAGLEPKP